ncbi:hypothetical protein ACHAP7_007178 [Fusarium lateritium]
MVKSLDGLTGSEVAEIAYAQQPISPSGLGLVCEILIYILTVICAIIIGLRVYLPFVVASVFGVLCVHYGVGATDTYLDQFEMRNFLTVRGMEYLLLYELIYYASSTITKFAIAVTILYICVEKRYKYIMYAIMSIMALTCTICLVWLFVNCVPFAAYWNPGLGHCKDDAGFLYLSYVGTSVQVVADWACATTPFFIVYSLQMTRCRKVAVVVVLGLGVLASIAALMRIISYQYIDTVKYPKDQMGEQHAFSSCHFIH